MIATQANLHQNKSTHSFSHKIYWLDRLSRELTATKIEPNYLNPSEPLDRGSLVEFNLPISLSQKIIKLANKSNLSIYIVLLACWQILLQKYTGNNKIIVGSPSYNRLESFAKQESAKILPIRSTIDLNSTFKSFLFKVRRILIEAYIHQDCSFDEISYLLKSEQNLDFNSILDTVFLLDKIHNQEAVNRSNCSLIVSCSQNDGVISGNIKYSEQLFPKKSIQYIISAYLNIIESVINNIYIKISDIAFLNKGDCSLLLSKFNNNSSKYPIDKTIAQLFAEQVEQTPNNIAAVTQQDSLTYEELNNQANQLAHLLKNIGIKAGDFVAILKDRDLDFLIGIIAVLKVGGVYLPVDSTYPAARIKYMLSNSEAKFLLTDSISSENNQELLFNCPHLRSIICLDTKSESQILHKKSNLKIYDRANFEELTTVSPETNYNSTDPAYMLYTSGSTGLPKGAIIRHDGAINHIYAQFDQLGLGKEFTFLQSAPSSTDISVWQFLAPLLIGGKTVIVDLETVAFAEKLFNALKSEKITVIELVPALFKGLLEYSSNLSIPERELPDLQWMILSGESAPIKLINEWLSIYPQIKIANAYGPTEAADDITQFILDKPLPANRRTVPIGKPLANLNLYILDEQMKLLPIGAPGEICVSGIGVGHGYWKNEQKTKSSFVPNPFASKLINPQNHEVIYKTGDLGRWLPDGNIEFLGRIDHQVKIRGFRIELGEIEAVLREDSNVRETAVIVREDNPDDKRIVAYVVPVAKSDRPTKTKLIPQLRDLLDRRLPGHMIPAAIVFIEALPLAPSGKIDRKALPIPDFQDESEVSYVAPRTPTEEIVVDIWCQILKHERIGIHDNFFNLGGHSLLATQVISKLRQALEIELPLRSLFEAPTVAQLVEQIGKMLTVKKLQLSQDATNQKYEEIEL